MVKDCYVALTGDVTGVTSDVTCWARWGSEAGGVSLWPNGEPDIEPYMDQLIVYMNQLVMKDFCRHGTLHCQPPEQKAPAAGRFRPAAGVPAHPQAFALSAESNGST